jgi:GNAT superfamily N-acetyltransferase
MSPKQREGVSANGMIEIVNVRNWQPGLQAAADYFHAAWSGIHRDFYLDAILHSSGADSPLPRFYLLLKAGRPIGCYGLAANDFISRHDLWPWLVALHVDEAERGRALGSRMLEHGVRAAGRAGFQRLYLTTDHDGYYEKYGWRRIEDGYDRDGAACRIYVRETTGR